MMILVMIVVMMVVIFMMMKHNREHHRHRNGRLARPAAEVASGLPPRLRNMPAPISSIAP